MKLSTRPSRVKLRGAVAALKPSAARSLRHSGHALLLLSQDTSDWREKARWQQGTTIGSSSNCCVIGQARSGSTSCAEALAAATAAAAAAAEDMLLENRCAAKVKDFAIALTVCPVKIDVARRFHFWPGNIAATCVTVLNTHLSI